MSTFIDRWTAEAGTESANITGISDSIRPRIAGSESSTARQAGAIQVTRTDQSNMDGIWVYFTGIQPL